MGNPLLPQAVNKVHDRKLRHVAIFRPEWWKEGDFFFPRRERESNLSLWHDDVGLGQFFTYLNGLSHLVIFMYLFVALFIFIREISFNLNSEYRQLMHFSWIACLHPPPPPPPLSLPRHACCYVLRKPLISDDVCWFARTFFGLFAILSFYWDTY